MLCDLFGVHLGWPPLVPRRCPPSCLVQGNAKGGFVLLDHETFEVGLPALLRPRRWLLGGPSKRRARCATPLPCCKLWPLCAHNLLLSSDLACLLGPCAGCCHRAAEQGLTPARAQELLLGAAHAAGAPPFVLQVKGTWGKQTTEFGYDFWWAAAGQGFAGLQLGSRMVSGGDTGSRLMPPSVARAGIGHWAGMCPG